MGFITAAASLNTGEPAFCVYQNWCAVNHSDSLTYGPNVGVKLAAVSRTEEI